MSKTIKQAAQFSKTYCISFERDQWFVSVRKTGSILLSFDHKYQAEDYIVAQGRADEQAAIMAAYNDAQELRCLAAEFAKYEMV